MNMSNVLLILLAIALLWGAINLDRSIQPRVVEEQSSQLNDSMEFLRKLKKKSPNELSNDERINAYRETVNRAASMNPEMLNQIGNDFEGGTKANSSELLTMLQSTSKINTDLEQLEAQSTEMKITADQETKVTVTNLGQLISSIQDIEVSSGDFSNQSAVLAKDIAEVKRYLS